MAKIIAQADSHWNAEDTDCLHPISMDKEIREINQSSPERSDKSLESEEVTCANQSDDEVHKTKSKKRVIKFSESGTSSESDVKENFKDNFQSRECENTESDDDLTIFKSSDKASEKSRIRNVLSSDSDSQSGGMVFRKNEEQQIRLKNKNKSIREKFNGLRKSRVKKVEVAMSVNSDSDSSGAYSSEKNNDDLTSVDNIKKIIKERMSNLKSTICDPDTSDEEGEVHVRVNTKKNKSTKLISPKPMRMSAKQAMENMHKIKSESNRMMREKEVSLPYHRTKALSLKDIMSRRKPAVSSDGKALPIKMNDQQLRQYAEMLEQRQKEMMELCKSDSDDEHDKITNSEINADTEDAVKTKNENSNVEDIDEQIDQVDSSLPEAQIIKQVDNSIPEAQTINQVDEILPNETVIKDVVESINPIETSTGDVSAEMSLVYNDSLDESKETTDIKTKASVHDKPVEETVKTNADINTETNSQNISLHMTELYNNTEVKDANGDSVQIISSHKEVECSDAVNRIDDFSDDDLNMEDIDALIENTEIITGTKEAVDSPMLIRDSLNYNNKPKLTGAPGMVIDLDGSDATAKKLSGVELLKERFTYFSNLKTPEEIERDKEKRIKPGTLHLKLKHELEQQIAEQRSLEWAKRLEEERQHHKELDALRGEDSEEDEIDKIEAKLEGNDKEETSEEEEEEEELCEEKPRQRNPMLADEAEESDCEENIDDADRETPAVEDNQSSDSDESSDESSSEDETINLTEKPKKSRILRAFADSDDEVDLPVTDNIIKVNSKTSITDNLQKSQPVMDSQDEELQLAQLQKSYSEDLFTSQDSSIKPSNGQINSQDVIEPNTETEIPTQSFSILNPDVEGIEISTQSFSIAAKDPEEMNVITETQPLDDNLDAIVGMCSGSFSQNLAPSLIEKPPSPSQDLGDDILDMCTGKFYDNQFVSQDNANSQVDNAWTHDAKDIEKDECRNDDVSQLPSKDVRVDCTSEDKTLKSILDELDGPEFDAPKANKYFCGDSKESSNKENLDCVNVKRRFVIDSDDEGKETGEDSGRKKKLKKRKPEKRALQISDNEDELNNEIEQDMEDEAGSELDEDERLVEYDSEENEVIVTTAKPKNKRKTTEFFEQEAELTSEDEWVGSGDEDERGLDRMEREEGDDDQFHEGELQRELGQIHMRDVLDQDKREVRIIQELLFEDGDLGDGHRQRKFRWKDDNGTEESGTVPDLTDTQEEEFESEEIWRKQRHEREMYLKQMKQKDSETEENLNVSINRNTIIKANLSSRTMSSLLLEVNKKCDGMENQPTLPVLVKSKDVPSPKKPPTMFQQNYHGSILNRGSSALARLAAIATPLAGDEDAKIGSLGPTNKRNFVFATLTQEEKKPKVTKRKSDANAGTPRLLKKMKTEEKQPILKSSLLDHLKA